MNVASITQAAMSKDDNAMTCNPLTRMIIALICALTIAGTITAQSNTTEFQAQDDLSSLSPPLVIVDPSPPLDLPGHDRGSRMAKEEPEEPDEDQRGLEWFGGNPWWEWSRISGNWGGFRTQLEDAGISFESSLTLEWTDVMKGGIARRSSNRRIYDANITLDLDTIMAVQGGTIFADFYSTTGESASAIAGDIQTLSNIETDGSVDEIAELWYEQWLFDDRVRVKVGKVDANTEFSFVDAAGEFINSSAGFTPSIFVLPTYTDGATSGNLFYYPNDNIYLGFGFYDGAAGVDGVPTGRRGPKTFFDDELSDDYFLISEFGYNWDLEGHGPGRAAIGGWYHTGDFDRFDGTTEDGTGGFYLLAEQQIWQRNPDADDEQGLYGFLQYGFANEDVSEIVHHIAGGLFLSGTFAGREDDSTGVYISRAVLSDEAGAGFDEDETAIELFYKFQLTPSVSIKPDLHYILNPSGDSTVDDAVVGTLRVEITF